MRIQMTSSGAFLTRVLLATLVLFLSRLELNAQGIILSGAGPVHRAMGGASTAMPLDAIGGLYWNPATTAALPNEIGFGFDLLLPVLSTESAIAGLGGGVTDAEPGVTPLPSVGWVHRREGSRFTFGLGLVPLAGVNTNYPASETNPIFLPPSNSPGVPGGIGRLLTEASFLQLAPTLTYAVTERFSISAGPTLTMGKLVFDPLIVGPANDADASGSARYAAGRSTRWHWGGGAQVGAYYVTDNCWHFGTSVKSPQWMEEFRFFSEDELDRPIVVRFGFDMPMIVSLGTAYSGFENLVLALDLRYFDFRNTQGIGSSGFTADGALRGIDHSNVFALAMGGQYQMTDKLQVRLGYTFNQSPSQDSDATIGVAAPLYYQHQIATGASYRLAKCVSANISYTYYPTADLTGPIVTAAGAVPGSTLTTSESVHILSIGSSVRY